VIPGEKTLKSEYIMKVAVSIVNFSPFHYVNHSQFLISFYRKFMPNMGTCIDG
jgi:hypothetical protein